ncbi:D-alanyl-D-alanine carboxypeptidase [Aureimonas flava]|uniref:serine-type D-Ala-D-Ala carboxypeptidase n=1 Tax=Aureimonas flava TaxID=2320271 RepID=A0A3A1WRY2_9HYPH|nr:D-alanyl-D-alanine carboxypeptidase family protein [Aureimonas flava]RIY03844.1 D-alanyl-D-alanine carboxypeptidase [Aureimonas flava]
MRHPKRVLRNAILLAAILSVGGASAQNRDDAVFPETAAKVAVVIDGKTGGVLFEKNGRAPFPPASLAKIMTAEILFGALASGQFAPDAALPVSTHAWRTGGAPSRTATMFAAVRSDVPVDALAQGLVVQAANDAAIVIAEHMDGSERAFADRMNREAEAIGMTDSRFVNPTGLPEGGQEVTARDMAILARHIRYTYPERYALYAQPQFEWNKILQRNRNPLLGTVPGATGMATGFSPEGGYSIVGVVEGEGGRLTILVLAGLDKEQSRLRETVALADWAGSAFEEKAIFSAGATIADAPVFGGVAASVPLVLDEDLVALVPKRHPEVVSASVHYDTPLRAPVRKGDRIGTVELRIDNRFSLERELRAGEDVGEGTFASRAVDAMHELAFGWIRSL